MNMEWGDTGGRPVWLDSEAAGAPAAKLAREIAGQLGIRMGCGAQRRIPFDSHSAEKTQFWCSTITPPLVGSIHPRCSCRSRPRTRRCWWRAKVRHRREMAGVEAITVMLLVPKYWYRSHRARCLSASRIGTIPLAGKSVGAAGTPAVEWSCPLMRITTLPVPESWPGEMKRAS